LALAHLPTSPQNRPVSAQDNRQVSFDGAEVPLAAQIFGDHFGMLLDQRTKLLNRRTQIAPATCRAEQYGSQILIHSTGN
jgi:hypothetical protein